jgi:hypothetical protein
MNIPDTDPKAALLYCSKCGKPCAYALLPFPGTLVAAICSGCVRKMVDESEKEEKL